MSVEKQITGTDLYRFRIITSAALSPDGKTAVYSLQRVSRDNEKTYQDLHLVSLDGKIREKQFTYGEWSDFSPSWSPDGNSLAFLSTRQENKTQIYIIPSDGGEGRPLTRLDGVIASPAWSPDGKTIAFSYLEKDRETALMEKDPSKKKLGITHRHYKTMFYKEDGGGYLPENRWRIMTVDVKSGKTRYITPGDSDAHSPLWTPDGSHITFFANTADDPGLHPYEWEYFRVPSRGGEAEIIRTFEGSKGDFSISHDGRFLAFYGSMGKGKWWKKSELWIHDMETGTTHSLTKEHDFTTGTLTLNDTGGVPPFAPVWSADDAIIYFPVSRNGATYVASADVNTGKIDEENRRDSSTGGLSTDAATDRAITITGTLDAPSLLELCDFRGKRVTISDPNRKLFRSMVLPRVEEIRFTSARGVDIQGWIMKPPGFDPKNTYPSILEIHGGPRVQYGYHFMHEFNYLASAGYVVYFCNPRGSQGYGEKHSAAIWNNWGTVDYDDLMAFADLMAEKEYIDIEKMGVTGGSYGGYMTNWIIGHTHRFAAAVTQRSVSNLVSMWGTSDASWMFQFEFGETPPWEDVENYWRQSPMKYMANAKTPTLVIHSENDFRCAIEQGEQVYTALKYLGVDTEFVRFPDESHGLSRGGRTDRRIKRLEFILSWFDKYLK